MFEGGKRYRVWYEAPGKKYPRCFVGTFLGTSYSGGLQFDLRPDAGTSEILESQVLAFRPTRAAHMQPVGVVDIPSIAEHEGTGYEDGPEIEIDKVPFDYGRVKPAQTTGKEKHGCQFVLVGIGDQNLPCEDEDADVMAQALSESVPLIQFNIIRGESADKIVETLAALKQSGKLDDDLTKVGGLQA